MPPRTSTRFSVATLLSAALLMGGLVVPRAAADPGYPSATPTTTPSAAPTEASATPTPDAPAPAPSTEPTPTASVEPTPAAPTTAEATPATQAPSAETSAPEATPTASDPSAAPTTLTPASGPTQTIGATTLTSIPVPSGAIRGAQSTTSTTIPSDAVAHLTAATADFSLVGLKWAEITGSPSFTVRTQQTDDTWSQWYDLEALDDSPATDAIFVGDSTAVEVLVRGPEGTSVSGLELSLVASPKLASDAAATAAESTKTTQAVSYVGQPGMVSRAQWGAAAPNNCSNPADTIRGVVVHHTAGANNYSPDQSASIVRGMQSYHLSINWCDIGYNFLIDKYGTIFEGRSGGIDLPVIGAHATSWNPNTIGISFMMNSQDDPSVITATAINSAARLLAWKLAGFYRDPNSITTLAGKTLPFIFGHGDVMSTACPGTGVRAQLPNLRATVAALMAGGANTEIKAAWTALGADSGALGSPYRLEQYAPNGSRYTVFTNAIGFFDGTRGVRFAVGGIDALYSRLGYFSGPLGYPVANSVAVTGGSLQMFDGGRVYELANRGTFAVLGSVGDAYANSGAHVGPLGYPTNNAVTYPDGVTQQNFDRGRIYNRPGVGTFIVLGAIAGTYAANPAILGYPSANEVALDAGRAYQQFQTGGIYYQPNVGTFAVSGAIATVYASQGNHTGALGYPTGSAVTSGSTTTQAFTGGTIVTDASGTRIVWADNSATTQYFINSVATMAQEAERTYRVPTSVSLAQAILESGWGASSLARYGHAYFGIKCTAVTGTFQTECMSKESLEYVGGTPVTIESKFRTYNSARDSFMDHGDFLANRTRYAAAFQTTTSWDFARAIAAAGYATDPTYGDKLVALMDAYDLYRYDLTRPTPLTFDASKLPVSGAIGTVYAQTGGASGPLSAPIGVAGTGPAGSSIASFNTGAIISGSGGVHPLSGKIWNTYRYDSMMRTLGVPTSDPVIDSARGFTRQSFSGGHIYLLNGASKAYAVVGAIRAVFDRTGGDTGALGVPISSENVLADGKVYQLFTGGRVYYVPGVGTFEILGAIGSVYARTGYHTGGLGYPTSIENLLPSGAVYQTFGSGRIYYVPNIGTFETLGAIGSAYAAQGYHTGSLGYPTSAEQVSAGGVVTQYYQGGRITYTPGVGITVSR